MKLRHSGESAEGVEQDHLPALSEKLKALVPILSSIRQTTATPSFAVGVLHHGEVIFTHSEGVRDVNVEPPEDVDLDTVYLLGSLTKGFISASCGILVDEGKLAWERPISTYVPFEQVHDPVISQRANLLDALSHSTGFPQIDISWYGAQGETITPSEELFHIVNNIPVFPDFRSRFHYTNWMYAIAGRIIENVSGDDGSSGWGSFVRRRIFQPLGMDRSCSNRDDLIDPNFAEPHTALDGPRPARLPIPMFSDKTLTGASAAIWSTVPDMLKWAAAILDRLDVEAPSQTSSSRENDTKGNPLRQISRILSAQFQVTENSINENSYGLGWARHLLPSTHLGWLSINGPQPDHVIGQASRPRLLLYHGGQITGYLNSLYLLPETNSAVVILTNAQGAGDCSDWIGQAVIQELFDLKPRIDFEAVVRQSAKTHLEAFQKMKDAYEAGREQDTRAPEKHFVLGTYYNDDIRMTIEVTEDGEGELVMRLNRRDSQRHKLSHYHHNTFGFLPSSRDEQQLRCLVDYFVYEQFLISFNLSDGREEMGSLSWKMQEDLPPLDFSRLE